MSNNGTGILTGADLLARARREVDLPEGGKVVVGRVGPGELTEILGHLPDVTALATASEDDAAKVAKRPEGRAVLRAVSSLLLVGVIAPKLGDDRQTGPTPQDFTLEEQLLLFKEILEVSGYTKAAGGKVLPLSRTAG